MPRTAPFVTPRTALPAARPAALAAALAGALLGALLGGLAPVASAAQTVTPPPAPPAATPPEARDGGPMPPEAALAAVGPLGGLRRGRAGCTAALVAPDRIVTAGHCMGGKGPRGDIRRPFAPAHRTEGAPAPTTTLRFERLSGPGIDSDIAVAAIRRAPAGIAPLPPAPWPEIGGRAVVVTYPNGDARDRHVSVCPVATRAADTALLACPAVSGMSGGAVLAETSDGWGLVGILAARVGPAHAYAVGYDPAAFD